MDNTLVDNPAIKSERNAPVFKKLLREKLPWAPRFDADPEDEQDSHMIKPAYKAERFFDDTDVEQTLRHDEGAETGHEMVAHSFDESSKIKPAYKVERFLDDTDVKQTTQHVEGHEMATYSIEESSTDSVDVLEKAEAEMALDNQNKILSSKNMSWRERSSPPHQNFKSKGQNTDGFMSGSPPIGRGRSSLNWQQRNKMSPHSNKNANFSDYNSSWRAGIHPSPRGHAIRNESCSPIFRRTPGAHRCIGPVGGAQGPSSLASEKPVSLFKPISRDSPSAVSSGSKSSTPDLNEQQGLDQWDGIQLMVGNLDYNISAREWKKILYAEFQQQVQVQGIYIQTQQDNTNIGYVKVATTDEARYAISQFHRKKIGYKRIHVSLVNNLDSSNSSNLRAEVISVLKDVSDSSLPMFKFIELFEKKHHHNISVSDLYRMKDTVEIEELGVAGRSVSLLQSLRSSPHKIGEHSPDDSLDIEVEMGNEHPVCLIHCEEGSSEFLDAIEATELPNVKLQLKSIASQVHTMLQSHEGSIPLMSFLTCHKAEFNQNIQTSAQGGVPLEHLISCVPGVKVAASLSGVKKIQWAENKPMTPPIEFGRLGSSPLMTQQQSQFSREVVDLLKASPHCRVPFNKFIPTYHHHFGRQCRVADYGYTKLLELFEAIPHIIQILGTGSRRQLTLAHRAQVRRFTNDLLRILKSQVSKQITIVDFLIVYRQLIGKNFDITDYGVCYIEDLLCEIPETSILVDGQGTDMVLSLPRRNQTGEERERTWQFCFEVVDLLKHSQHCSMAFNKFIPAYHHHFGKQCRVADYGFTKLLELFEAIPHIVTINEDNEEKILCLTEIELLNVLEEQVNALLKAAPNNRIPVPEFLNAFMRHHGHALRLQDYGVSTVVELVKKVEQVAELIEDEGKLIIAMVDNSRAQKLAQRILLLLMDLSNGYLDVDELCEFYHRAYKEPLDMNEVTGKLSSIVQVTDLDNGGVVKLCPLQMFARDVRTLLRANQGSLSLRHLEEAYSQHYGVGLVPPAYGFPCTVALLQAVPHVVTLRGKGYRKTVLLNQDFQGNPPNVHPNRNLHCPLPLPFSPDERRCLTPFNDSGIQESQDEQDKELITLVQQQQQRQGFASPWDAFTSSIPSSVSSPDLQSDGSHMQHDSNPMCVKDLLHCMSLEERALQRSPVCQTPVSGMLKFAATLLPSQILQETSPPISQPSEYDLCVQEELMRVQGEQQRQLRHIQQIQMQQHTKAGDVEPCTWDPSMMSNIDQDRMQAHNPRNYLSCDSQPLGLPAILKNAQLQATSDNQQSISSSTEHLLDPKYHQEILKHMKNQDAAIGLEGAQNLHSYEVQPQNSMSQLQMEDLSTLQSSEEQPRSHLKRLTTEQIENDLKRILSPKPQSETAFKYNLDNFPYQNLDDSTQFFSSYQDGSDSSTPTSSPLRVRRSRIAARFFPSIDSDNN